MYNCERINCLLAQRKTVYDKMLLCVNPDDLTKIFNEMNVTHSGRALVYLVNCSDDVT